jgi:phosphoribosylformylglycinamidine cyclo-ligase
MPKGVPVATVGIDNGQNAAHLAARILGKGKKNDAIPRTYAEAGVDENEVARGLSILGDYVRKSFSFGKVSHDYGQYANMVRVDDDLYLALATDGVGSKVLIAELAEKYNTIGIDCVAMNVNDLICVGATPVGFVDYLASEKPLSDGVLKQVGEGLLEGCRQSNIPILGGETAILPEMIRGAKGSGLDLAGTAVGIARKAESIDGSKIVPGDALLGIASNGIHSNGFTLARKVLLQAYDLEYELASGVDLKEELLRPTRIYVPHFRALREAGVNIKGLAHVTGSGFRKILRLGEFYFRINKLLPIPTIFELIQSTGEIDSHEMFTTFNMGIGLVVVVSSGDADRAQDILDRIDRAQVIGTVVEEGKAKVEISEHEVLIE